MLSVVNLPPPSSRIMKNIDKLAKVLGFQYLHHNGFESPEDRANVLAKGLAKFESRLVAKEALDLGQRFFQQIRGAHLAKLEVRFINDAVGHGCFAAEDIEAGSFVGEYTGIVRENNRRYFEPLNNYCYEYPILDSLDRSYVIDATQGNLTRFINHSANPNLKPVYAFIEGMYHCIFLAISDIKKKTQLTYDYGKSYWYIRESPEQIP